MNEPAKKEKKSELIRFKSAYLWYKMIMFNWDWHRIVWNVFFLQDGRLETGDLLLSINDTDVRDKTRDEVVDILKQCGQGSVRLFITREILQVGDLHQVHSIEGFHDNDTLLSVYMHKHLPCWFPCACIGIQKWLQYGGFWISLLKDFISWCSCREVSTCIIEYLYRYCEVNSELNPLQ